VTTIGAYDAKTHLPRLLDEVEAGGTVTITRHGREVARLVPVAPGEGTVGEVVEALRAARMGVRLGGLSITELIREGRA
jgi:prevent-host-death family protein